MRGVITFNIWVMLYDWIQDCCKDNYSDISDNESKVINLEIEETESDSDSPNSKDSENSAPSF